MGSAITKRYAVGSLRFGRDDIKTVHGADGSLRFGRDKSKPGFKGQDSLLLPDERGMVIHSGSGERIPVHFLRIEHRTIRTHLPVSDILVHRIVAGLNYTALANPVTACHAGFQGELTLDTP